MFIGLYDRALAVVHQNRTITGGGIVFHAREYSQRCDLRVIYFRLHVIFSLLGLYESRRLSEFLG